MARRVALFFHPRFTEQGYARLTTIERDIAARHAKGRIVSVLEGGYALNALASSVAAHVRALRD